MEANGGWWLRLIRWSDAWEARFVDKDLNESSGIVLSYNERSGKAPTAPEAIVLAYLAAPDTFALAHLAVHEGKGDA